jgi:hypothetical protein
MSEELKQKLQDFEVAPPASAWNKIAASLDEEIVAEFPHTIFTAEIQPPASAWDKIKFSLDTGIEEYPSKLYELEVAPPANTWQKISSALEEEKNLPRIPSKARIIPFVKYAVAASLLAAIAFGAFKFLNPAKNANSSVATNQPQKKDQPTSGVQPRVEDSSVTAVNPPSNNLPKERAVLTKNDSRAANRYNSQPSQTLSYMTETMNDDYIQSAAYSAVPQASLRGSVPGSTSFLEALDRYLTFTNSDGALVRISKKLAQTLGCLYPNATSEQYKACQDQLRKWREKIAQMPVKSSPDSFIDILNMIKSAQENDQL